MYKYNFKTRYFSFALYSELQCLTVMGWNYLWDKNQMILQIISTACQIVPRIIHTKHKIRISMFTPGSSSFSEKSSIIFPLMNNSPPFKMLTLTFRDILQYSSSPKPSVKTELSDSTYSTLPGFPLCVTHCHPRYLLLSYDYPSSHYLSPWLARWCSLLLHPTLSFSCQLINLLKSQTWPQHLLSLTPSAYR